jgi:hypothetical protein
MPEFISEGDSLKNFYTGEHYSAHLLEGFLRKEKLPAHVLNLEWLDFKHAFDSPGFWFYLTAPFRKDISGEAKKNISAFYKYDNILADKSEGIANDPARGTFYKNTMVPNIAPKTYIYRKPVFLTKGVLRQVLRETDLNTLKPKYISKDNPYVSEVPYFISDRTNKKIISAMSSSVYKRVRRDYRIK